MAYQKSVESLPIDHAIMIGNNMRQQYYRIYDHHPSWLAEACQLRDGNPHPYDDPPELELPPGIKNPFDPNDLATNEVKESYLFVQKLFLSCHPHLVKLPPPPPFQSEIIRDNDQGLKTLVLDLDETLIHCPTNQSDPGRGDFCLEISVQKQLCRLPISFRPYLIQFLQEVSEWYRVVVFTASAQPYAEGLVSALNVRTNNAISHYLSRESCIRMNGVFVKDLRILNPDTEKILMVDNAIEAFTYQLSNGILIRSWYGDKQDQELLHLTELLKQDVMIKSESVPKILRPLFGIQKSVNHARPPSDPWYMFE